MTAPLPQSSTPTAADAAIPAPLPRNPIGRVALILGIVLVAAEILRTVFAYLVPFLLQAAGQGYNSMSGLLVATSILVMVIAAATAVCGLVGLSRPGLPRGAAGAGAALGIASLVNGLVGFAMGPIASLLVSPAIAPFSG